jgi:hypothetical protein
MNAQKSIRRHLFISVIVIVLLVGGIGGWAATSEFAGAVIAQGRWSSTPASRRCSTRPAAWSRAAGA